jgi:hypothetical protein
MVNAGYMHARMLFDWAGGSLIDKLVPFSLGGLGDTVAPFSFGCVRKTIVAEFDIFKQT